MNSILRTLLVFALLAAAGFAADTPIVAEWRKKAKESDAGAQFNLGNVYAFGLLGVPKDSIEALKWYRLAAEQGDAAAQFNLGLMYDIGTGIPKHPAEAVKWYRKAADQGLSGAQNSLGNMYANGEGVPKDSIEAFKWYRLAADQRSAAAQLNIGLVYDIGKGVLKDSAEAVKWYRLAADQGNDRAQFYLGLMYDIGTGIPKDSIEAVKWYRLAADQGLSGAQNSLGNMYANGEGVPKDSIEAVKWYRLAADQGSADAQDNLAVAYYNGEGVQKDLVQARALWTVASEKGHESAKKNLATLNKKNISPNENNFTKPPKRFLEKIFNFNFIEDFHLGLICAVTFFVFGIIWNLLDWLERKELGLFLGTTFCLPGIAAGWIISGPALAIFMKNIPAIFEPARMAFEFSWVSVVFYKVLGTRAKWVAGILLAALCLLELVGQRYYRDSSIHDAVFSIVPLAVSWWVFVALNEKISPKSFVKNKL